MQDFIINAVIWILALYGLIEIIKILYTYIHIRILILMEFTWLLQQKSRRESRGLLRTTIFKIHGKEEIPKNIIITDLDSRDNTLK